MTKREWTYLTVFSAGPRSGWPLHTRQACPAGLSAARRGAVPPLLVWSAHRHSEVGAEFFCEIDQYAGVDTALSVQELGMVVERYDRAVPDVGMDVEPAAAVASEGDEPLRCHIVSRQGERHDSPCNG